MVLSLFYRRPSFVPSSRASVHVQEEQHSINGSIASNSAAGSNGIPAALSFDRIIAGGTCPPCTVRDFMNYLKYIEHAAENLQFYLWYRDYTARWERLPDAQKLLSPEWTKRDAEAAAAAARTPKKNLSASITQLVGSFDSVDDKQLTASDLEDPFNTPPTSSSLDDLEPASASVSSQTGEDLPIVSVPQHHVPPANIANTSHETASMQPYRDEVNRIISIYIADGAPRELNLSGRERLALLNALQYTTHPSTFRDIVTTAEYSLRKQAHPNFIRWSICNGNRPRVIFARGLGVANIVVGLLADLLLTLSCAARGWRVLPFLAWFIGIATLFAAWKGMCVVLHGLHHRHLKPWELFGDTAEESGTIQEKHLSLSSLITSSTNSYEDEPWVPRYEKRSIIRKILDREVWIEEPALRQIQDTIFVQAVLISIVTSSAFVGFFCAVPAGNLF